MTWPNRFSRAFVLDRVRRIALHALWRGDIARWDRATDVLTREGRRVMAKYTTERRAMSHV